MFGMASGLLKYHHYITCVYLLLQIYKEDCIDLLVPATRREKDQLTIREDVTGGIKVSNICVVLPGMASST